MKSPATSAPGKAGKPSWVKVVARYQTPDTRIALWQVFSSFAPYFLMQALMFVSLRYSYWLTLLLAFPTAGFLMRIFIILHDCGHGSFFKNQKWNDVLGVISGVLAFTPYFHWRHSHAIHHAGSGDLDRRGIGDVQTLTVREYNALPWHRRLGYRLYRHPVIMFVFGAPLLFLVFHRFSYHDFPARERHSVHWTNLGLLLVGLAASALIGWREYLLIQVPIMWIGSVVGVWMFYVQHQFEETYWKPHPEWDYFTASLKGSSYYKLPRVLQWFTGNIGFHHVHHLSPKIPNYQLERCFRENLIFHDVSTLTLWSSFKTLTWRLWDEDLGRMVGFARARAVRRQQAQALAR
jgi:omega-6 fatty acid desaturase (delta-12 desaturase)